MKNATAMFLYVREGARGCGVLMETESAEQKHLLAV
jgi:hypothetical protein